MSPEPSAAVDANQPLRILHYVPGVKLHQGGVVRAILDLCTIFAARGHQVTLAVYEDKDLQTEWLTPSPGRPTAFVVPMPHPPFKLLNRQAMRMIDDALARTDVLHLHGPWLDGNRQIANLARKRGVPYVVSLHGMLDDWSMAQRGFKKRLYLALVGRRILNRAAIIHCTAAGELTQASKWFSNPQTTVSNPVRTTGRTTVRTTVLPCLVDLAPFEHLTAATDSAPHEPKLLFLSRLHEQKGVDLLIQAAGLLAGKKFPFKLLLAGTGTPAYEKHLHQLVDQLNLKNHVIFLGHLNGAVKLSTFRTADLFVHPTRHENFGLVLIEAMATGIPLLTTRGTDIWQEIQSAGGEISDADPQAIADNIIRLLGNPVELARRARRGREWVFANLATDALSARYEAFYRSAITRPSQPLQRLVTCR